MICKAVAEGASAFYFYKVGKGELFFTCRKVPPAGKACCLSFASVVARRTSTGRSATLQKHAWSRKSKTVGLCPTCPLAFSKARQNFKGKTSFFQWRYGLSGEGGRSWTLSIPASIWKGLSETLRGRTFFTCEKFSCRYAPPPQKHTWSRKTLRLRLKLHKLFEKSLTKNFIFCKRKFFYKWEAKS